MTKHQISLYYLKHLVCRHCDEFVTCGPVHVLPDTSILCGRCRSLSKNIYRNYAYEVLASIFSYPCKNWENYCPAILPWNGSLEHEMECNYYGCISLLCSHPSVFCKGRRYIKETDVRLQPLPDYLLQNVKCALCECYLSSDPTFIQPDGRNICHRCVNVNGEPPNCLRNIAYEKLAKIILFPCIYKNRGCPARLSFGREICRHETTCSYGEFSKSNLEYPKKEKGIIKTHTGHVYGTITPNAPLFAPPTDSSPQVNSDLMKSLIKKQERKIKRADQIGSEFERTNSADDSYRNSYTTYSVSSRSSTPDLKYTHNQIQIYEQVSTGSGKGVSRNSSVSSHNREPTQQSGYRTNLSQKSSFSQKSPYLYEPRVSEDTMYHENVDRSPSFHGGLGGSIGVGDKHLIDELKIRQNMIKRTHSLKESIKRDEFIKRNDNSINSGQNLD